MLAAPLAGAVPVSNGNTSVDRVPRAHSKVGPSFDPRFPSNSSTAASLGGTRHAVNGTRLAEVSSSVQPNNGKPMALCSMIRNAHSLSLRLSISRKALKVRPTLRRPLGMPVILL